MVRPTYRSKLNLGKKSGADKNKKVETLKAEVEKLKADAIKMRAKCAPPLGLAVHDRMYRIVPP